MPMCLAGLAGLLVADVMPLDRRVLVLAALFGGLGGGLAWRRRPARLLGLAVCLAALGGLRATLPQLETLGFASNGSSAIQAPLAKLRAAAEGGIQANLPEPQASLAAGVLLGGAGHLDAAFRLDLRRSGLAHLLVIDGFKQAVVAASVGLVGRRLLGARLASLAVVAVVAGYTLLSGAHPSAVRAGLMVGLASLASMAGRVADPLTSLVVAVLVIVGIDPRLALDVGLQLSVSATLGIVLLWPAWRRRLRRLPKWLAEPAGLTLAVGLATLPLELGAFQSVSLVSPVAHVLAAPLLPVVLVGGGLLALVSPLPALATAIGWLVWLPTTLLAGIIRVCGGLPAAALSTGRLPLGAGLALAGGLLAWGIWQLPELIGARRGWARWRREHAATLAPGTCLGACLGAAALFSLMRPDGRLHVARLGLERGDAVFVRAPAGQTLLVVAGRADANALADEVAAHLAVWEHRLDRVVVLDSAASKAVGPLLGRYPPGELVEAPSGARLDVGGGVALEVGAADGRLMLAMDEPGSAATHLDAAESNLPRSSARPSEAAQPTASGADTRLIERGPRSGPTISAARRGSAD